VRFTRSTGRRHPSLLSLFVPLALVALLGVACQPAALPRGPDRGRMQVFVGLGAWWDVYDWSPTFTRGAAPFGVADVDRLAASGVQTLYLQPSTFRHPDVVLDRARLRAIVDRARALGVRTVGWYLPRFVDVQEDLDRMVAMARFGFDGIGVDIESTANPDVADRNAKLVLESRFLRSAFPDLPIAAIPVTPVIWEELNRSWWPDFPYRQLADWYDAWLPMAYWTYRTPQSGWRDPYRYTAESVTRLRALTGRSDLPVHPIGGEAAGLTWADVDAMGRALVDTGAIGGSLYDDNITPRFLYAPLQQFRRGPIK
jgi:hypothetical protein